MSTESKEVASGLKRDELDEILVALGLKSPKHTEAEVKALKGYRYSVTRHVTNLAMYNAYDIKDAKDWEVTPPPVCMSSTTKVIARGLQLNEAVNRIYEEGLSALCGVDEKTIDGRSLSDFWKDSCNNSSKIPQPNMSELSTGTSSAHYSTDRTGLGISYIQLLPTRCQEIGTLSADDQVYSITICIRQHSDRSTYLLSFAIVRE